MAMALQHCPMAEFSTIHLPRSMSEIDVLYERVEYVEAALKFLRAEIKKHGETPELRARTKKEMVELKRVSAALDRLCDEWKNEDN